MERLSSSATFFYKFVFPTAWMGFSAAIGILGAITSSRPATFRGQLVVLVMLAAGAVLMGLVCAPLKRVMLRGDTLVISNYIREIEVPLGEVVDVKQPLFWTTNLRPVHVTFASQTAFGGTISFMPPICLDLFTESPVARRLRELSDSASAFSA